MVLNRGALKKPWGAANLSTWPLNYKHIVAWGAAELFSYQVRVARNQKGWEQLSERVNQFTAIRLRYNVMTTELWGTLGRNEQKIAISNPDVYITW